VRKLIVSSTPDFDKGKAIRKDGDESHRLKGRGPTDGTAGLHPGADSLVPDEVGLVSGDGG